MREIIAVLEQKKTESDATANPMKLKRLAGEASALSLELLKQLVFKIELLEELCKNK